MDILFGSVDGQDDDLCLRVLFVDLFDGLETVHFRHGKVHQDKIRPLLPNPPNGVTAVFRFTDNLKIRFRGKQGPQSFPEDGVVLRDDDFVRSPHLPSAQ